VLLLTIVGQEWLKGFARDYINRRIEPGVTAGIAAIERNVLPVLAKSRESTQFLMQEIRHYRADPHAYIDSVTMAELEILCIIRSPNPPCQLPFGLGADREQQHIEGQGSDAIGRAVRWQDR